MVRYADGAGKEYDVKLGLADVYVPRKIGEEVPIMFMLDVPEKGFGPARMRDGAFLTFVPWALGIMLAYGAAQIFGARR